MTTLYAIRHKTTGNYLQACYRGNSWWEGEKAKGSDVPKLFKTLGHARTWRTNWLKGRVVKRYITSDFDEHVELDYEPVPSRTHDQIEIVKVTLHFERDLFGNNEIY